MNEVDKKFWTVERQLKFPKAFDAYVKFGWKGSVCIDLNTGGYVAGDEAFEEMGLAFNDYEADLRREADETFIKSLRKKSNAENLIIASILILLVGIYVITKLA